MVNIFQTTQRSNVQSIVTETIKVKEAKARKGWSSSTRSHWRDQERQDRAPERATPEPADYQPNEEQMEEECYEGQDPRGRARGKKVNHLQDSPDPNKQALPPARQANPWPKWMGQCKSRRITSQREGWAWVPKVETERLLDEPDKPGSSVQFFWKQNLPQMPTWLHRKTQSLH